MKKNKKISFEDLKNVLSEIFWQVAIYKDLNSKQYINYKKNRIFKIISNVSNVYKDELVEIDKSFVFRCLDEIFKNKKLKITSLKIYCADIRNVLFYLFLLLDIEEFSKREFNDCVNKKIQSRKKEYRNSKNKNDNQKINKINTIGKDSKIIKYSEKNTEINSVAVHENGDYTTIQSTSIKIEKTTLTIEKKVDELERIYKKTN